MFRFRMVVGMIGWIALSVLFMGVLYGMVDLMFMGGETPWSILGMIGFIIVFIAIGTYVLDCMEDNFDLVRELVGKIQRKVGKR